MTLIRVIPAFFCGGDVYKRQYKGRALGTIGDFGCYSFHETKNYSMGEGGALVVNNMAYDEQAEILREKGTNRAKFCGNPSPA